MDIMETNNLHDRKQQFIQDIRPTRKGVTIEQLIEEQNYTPIKREDFFAKTKALDIQEPLEVLLAQLTR